VPTPPPPPNPQALTALQAGGGIDPTVARAIEAGKAALSAGTHSFEQLMDFLQGHAQKGTLTPAQAAAVKAGLQQAATPKPTPSPQPLVDVPSAMGGAKIEAGKVGNAVAGAAHGVQHEAGLDADALKKLYAGAKDLLGPLASGAP
jgi:hypothetical protein